jgi:hypothetical protein
MKFALSSLVIATHLVSTLALAQESKTDVQVGSASSEMKLKNALKNKKFAEDKDITDAKLQAESGSVSRYSLKFNLAYYGPILNDLSAQDQPNPDGGNQPVETAIAGSLGMRYRMSPATSISIGTGIKAVHPFGDQDRFDINSPFASYDMLSRIGDVQMRNSPGIGYVTLPNYVKAGQYGSLSYDLSAVYNFGTSGWAVGTDANVGVYLYNRDYVASDKKASSYSLSFAPNVKYNFSDTFSANTSVGMAWWNARSNDNDYALWNKTITERVGLGYAYTRDIYFAPYINMYPTRLALDTSTINVATIFSLL